MDAANWRRVSEVFDRVVDLPPSERGAALDSLCIDDDTLRRQVEALLRAADGQAAFERDVDTVRLKLAADWSRESEIESGIAIGGQIGAWRIVREIGRGGMGVVLLAERADGHFEQRVAIKLLAYPTTGLMQRFRQERQILAHLEHPHIARLIDGGLSPSGIPYFVMEYVEGLPIDDYCRKHKLGLAARLRLFATVCGAVQYAHQSLVVHRDLKPSNIFVTGTGVSKLLDFGVAKLQAAGDEEAQTHTAAHMLTPDYAAPEQLRGDPVTTATDVYALGVVLYQLLTGTLPRRIGRKHWSDAHAAFEHEPIAPSLALAADSELASERRAMRGDLDRIVLKALAAVPDRRYASAQAFADDLRAHLAGRPVSATADRFGYRLRKFVRRHRVAVLAGALVVATASAGVVGIAWEAQKAREQALRAAAEARNALDQAQRANAVREFMVGVLDQARPDATQGKPIVAHEMLDKAVVRLDDNADIPNAVRADVLDVLGKLYFDVGDYERSESLLERAVATSQSGTPADVRARALLDLAGTTWRKGEYPRAREYLHTSLALTQANGAADGALVSDIRHMLDAVEVEAGGATAEPVVRDTLQYDRALFGENSEQAERDWETLAWVLLRSRKYDEMEAAIDRALVIARAQHGEQHSTVASALEALGYVRAANLDFVGAEQTLAKALEIDRQILGANHPVTLRIQWGLLSDIAEQGRFAEVLPRHQQNLARERQVLGDNNSTVATTLASIGELQRELRQFAAAEASLHEALRIWMTIDTPADPELANVKTDLGSVFFLEGRYGEAETQLREALVIARRYFPERSLRVRRTLFWLAKTLTRDGRAQEAIALVEPIVAGLRGSVDPRAPAERYDLQYALNVLAEAQLADRQSDAALVSARAANDLGSNLFPKGDYHLGTSWLLIGMSSMANGRPADAESASREAIAVRRRVYVAADPRLIEARLALAEALLAEGKPDDVHAAIADVPALLADSAYPSEAKLRASALDLLRHADTSGMHASASSAAKQL